MSLSCSSAKRFTIIALVAISACAPSRDPRFKRTPLEPLDPNALLPKKPLGLADENEMLDTFFKESPDSPVGKVGACAWIEAYPTPVATAPRFRMAQNVLMKMQGGKLEVSSKGFRKVDDPSTAEKIGKGAADTVGDTIGAVAGTVYKIIENPFKSDKTKEEEDKQAIKDARQRVENYSFNGRIDIGASDIYQYGLASSLVEGEDVNGDGKGDGIPDRDAFLKQLDKEIRENAAFVVIQDPILKLKQLILNARLVDFYPIRNKTIAAKIADKLPGIFDTPNTRGIYRFADDTVPRLIFDNAIIDDTQFLVENKDNDQVRDLKIYRAKRILGAYEKALPLFIDDSWQTYETESRHAVNLAIQGLLSQDSAEQLCGAVLLNRSLAQMLNFIGYVKPPVVQDPTRISSRLPPVDELLDTPDGTKVKLCPMPGVFAVGQVRQLLDEKSLGNADKVDYNLPARIPRLAACDNSLAVAQGSWDFLHFQRFYIDQVATSDDWMGMLSGVSHLMGALNPGAPWWLGERQNPLMDIDKIDQVIKTAGVIPYKTHALSLALVNLGVAQLQHKHLVLLKVDGREAYKAKEDIPDADNAIAVRLALDARKAGTGGKITTTLYSATLLGEAAFKFGLVFKKLADWEAKQEEERKSFAYIRNRELREKFISNYNEFRNGLFASVDNLNLLTADGIDPVTKKPSIRETLKSLQLAVASLAASYVKPMENGKYGCFAEIHNDLDTGVETKVGECTDKDLHRWKQLMKTIAQSFGSPLFARYSEE